MVKLSRAQVSTLKKLRNMNTPKQKEDRNSYSLQCSLKTLSSLSHRNLVTSTSGLGSMAFPHNCILWTITEKGLQILMEKWV